MNDWIELVNDPLCGCGSTVTIERRTVETYRGKVITTRAWCTNYPEDRHPVPQAIQRIVAVPIRVPNPV